MDSKTGVVAVALAVVIVVALITSGIVYSVRQGTERRTVCIENGGTWVSNYCINPDGTVIEQ